MDLTKLYKLQEELDKYIIANNYSRTNVVMPLDELLDKTILALLVEVGELANETRCFKHWSTKGMSDKEIVLDEFSDILHFYLSIGNQIENKKINFKDVEQRRRKVKNLTFIFKKLYYWIIKFNATHEYNQEFDYESYDKIGDWIRELSRYLHFTDEEVEQAYLKKHEENYNRQKNGY